MLLPRARLHRLLPGRLRYDDDQYRYAVLADRTRAGHLRGHWMWLYVRAERGPHTDILLD